MEVKFDQILPILYNGSHVVTYRELRRVHGDYGARIYARAAAKGATLPNDLVMWSFYSNYWKDLQHG